MTAPDTRTQGTEKTAHHHGWRSIRAVGIGVGAVLAAVLVLAFLSPSILTEPIRAQAVPRVSQMLGREVKVGAIDARFLPRPTVTLKEVSVAGGAGEPSLVVSPEASVTVRVWPLLSSLGKNVELERLTLVRPEVNLVRRADGQWSYEDINENLEKLPETPPSEREYSIESASIEDGAIRVFDYSAAGASKNRAGVVALSDLDVTAENLGIGKDVEVLAKAALQSDAQNLEVDVAIDQLPENFAALAPGEWPKVQGHVVMKALSVEKFRAFFPASTGALVSGGRIDFDANLVTTADRNYALEGDVKLSSLSLRGQPASGGFAFLISVPNGRPFGMTGQIQSLRIEGPGIDLRGTANVAAQPTRLEFALEGNKLDTDVLLGVLPEAPKEKKAPESPVPDSEELLPEATRKQVAQAQVRGSLKLGEVRSGNLRATDLDAQASLDNGVLQLQKATARLYDGSVNMTGTRIDLNRARPEWALRADLSAVNLGSAMKEVSGARPIEGKVSSKLSLDGEGNVWAQIREKLTGQGRLQLDDAQLTSANLDAAVASGVAQALSKLGHAGTAEAVKEGKGTPLKDLQTSFEVNDGALKLAKPIEFKSSLGTGMLDGSIGLDQSLALTGTVRLPPDAVSRITQAKWKPARSVDVPVKITGTLLQPTVSGIDTAALAKSALPTEQLKKKATESVRDVAEDKLKGLFGKKK